MYKRNILNLLIVWISTFSLNARTIEATVIGDNSQLIGGASVIVYSMPDNIYLTGTVTNTKGHFKIVVGDSCNWKIKIQHIGYNLRVLTCDDFIRLDSIAKKFQSSDLQDKIVFKLKPKENTLSEIVVKPHESGLSIKNDIFYYNVQDLLRSRNPISCHDLLKEIPLINSPDGSSINLSGAPSGTDIYINGKKSQLSSAQLISYLKTLPAKQIKEVQIIYNPTPNWKTKNSVINIIISKSKENVFSGQIQALYLYKSISSCRPAGSLFFSTGKLSGNVMYDFNDFNSKEKSIINSKHNVNNSLLNIEETLKGKDFSLTHNIYAGLSYDIASDWSINLTYDGSFNPRADNYGISQSNIFSKSENFSTTRFHSNGISVSINNKKMIDAGLEYLNFNTTTHQMMNEISSVPSNNLFHSNGLQNNNRIRGYVDLTNSFKKGWSISYGVNYEFTRSINTQNNTLNLTNIGNTETHTQSDESIFKIYVGARKSFFNQKLNANVSLESELYKISDYHKYGLFPNATITFAPSVSHIMQIGYSSYKRYPSFWQKQDYISYESPYSIIIGNPNLKPATYNVAHFAYVFKGRYVFNTSYYRVDNFFLSQPFLDPSNLLRVRKMQNIDFSSALNFTISAPVHIGKLYSSNITISCFRDRYKSFDWHGIAFDRKKWTANLSLNNNFQIIQKPRLVFNITGTYKSPSIVGLWERTDVWYLNTSISCSILNNTLTLKISANDLLEKSNRRETINIDGQQYSAYSNFYGRSVSFELAYNFNGYINRSKKTHDKSRYGI